MKKHCAWRLYRDGEQCFRPDHTGIRRAQGGCGTAQWRASVENSDLCSASRKIALERRGYDCSVYAAGWPNASTYDEYTWLRDTPILDDIRPDLIVVGFVTNDLVSPSPDEDEENDFSLLAKAAHYGFSQLRSIFPGLFERLTDTIGYHPYAFTFSDYEDYIPGT